MRIEYRTARLRQAYEESDAAIRRWGVAVARKYIQRLEVLYAAQDFDEVRQLRSLRAHPLKARREGQWALDLTGRWRLIVIPSDNGKTATVVEVTDHYGD